MRTKIVGASACSGADRTRASDWFFQYRWLLIIAVASFVVRLYGADLPFETREFDYLPVPWSEKVEFPDPLRRFLGSVAETAWYGSLNEGIVRLPWLLAGLTTVLLTGALVTASFGRASGCAAALAIAAAGNEVLSGSTLNSGPWVVALSLGAIAAQITSQGSLVARTLAALALLLPVVSLTPAGWAPWLAVVFCTLQQCRRKQRRTQLLAAGVLTAGTVVLGLMHGQPQRSFWVPWNTAAILTLRDQWPAWVAPVGWTLFAVGLGRTARTASAGWVVSWLVAVIALAVLAQRGRWIVAEGTLAITLFPILVLVGVGAASVGAWLESKVRWPGLGFVCALGIVGLIVGFRGVTRGAGPWRDWRAVARFVADNTGSRDKLSTSMCRRAVVFYAPELFRELPVEADVGRALVVFPAAESGWLITPAEARLHPAWAQVEEWVRTFGVIDLSPQPGIHAFYYRRGGRQVALRRAADFVLPTATVRRGRLLADMFDVAGPLPTLLWKVDQLVLDPGAIVERNEGLVEVVEKLIAFGQFDRAWSLAERLLAFDPTWEKALQVRQRLHSVAPRTPRFFD
ncbi:hypothetical protein HRbin30_01270 [bacterium HR30]|nr:hypothetical protein HRbin30_01270 [bacterium HR30]